MDVPLIGRGLHRNGSAWLGCLRFLQKFSVTDGRHLHENDSPKTFFAHCGYRIEKLAGQLWTTGQLLSPLVARLATVNFDARCDRSVPFMSCWKRFMRPVGRIKRNLDERLEGVTLNPATALVSAEVGGWTQDWHRSFLLLVFEFSAMLFGSVVDG